MSPTLHAPTPTPTTLAPSALPLPPGPRGPARLPALLRLIRDPWFGPAALQRRYGDVIRLPVPFAELILLGHPDQIAQVNVAHRERYGRAAMVTDTMRVQGSPHHASWFEDDDGEWARGRKLLQPHFTQKALAELGGLFTEAIVEQVDGWGAAADRGAPLELHEQLKALALAVLYNAMFSRRIGPDEMHRLLTTLDDRMVATTVRTATFPLPGWLPRPRQAAGARGDDWLDHHLAELVADRRAAPTDVTDVLNVLLDARYGDGTPLEDHKIRTEMLFLVIGGHETTAAGMAWTFALLAQHPQIAERVREEVDALGGAAVGPEHLGRLPFARACFDEASRLQGSLVINPKLALEDDELGGYRIPRGATVLWSNVTLHRDPRFWGADADRFRPDRWLEGNAPAAAFQAFGRGPRMCLGKRLAYIEAVCTLATAFQRYRFAPPPNWEIRHQYRMSMGVRGGVPLRLARR
ncbi:Cytochrome P450 [Patulibacter medicamentivorans]|uniref:Cytochrome P450 n=1 Tax=Patulibacter medicamentivorans TaxID=1097667 RepID=H0E058_9ACTN|nr:cytochrome P450 [Patulibacter medicamentivorans]EHN12861.1 Cytochrome P450 [Patulibacter medicamentivorans]